MITLHHLNNSRSQRILWLLEELGMPYEIVRHERDPKTNLAPESLKRVHALGKSPVIEDDGQVIAESGAIVDYLARKDEERRFVVEEGDEAFLDWTFWMHYAEGSLMPPLVMRLVFEKIKTGPMPFFARPVARGIADKTHKMFLGPMIKSHLEFVEDHLARYEWFAAGRLTAADFQMSFPLEAVVASGMAGKRYPNIQRYVEHYQQRPAYRRALEAGGPYAYA
jgi:glutathione S-transferase